MDFSNNIPAGLVDNNSEFFGSSNNIHHLSSGTVEIAQTLYKPFYNLIHQEITRNKSISKCLDLLGLDQEEQRVMKYYDCNYSGFDNNPDMIDHYTLGEREYVPCEFRETCEHEGILCKLPYNLTVKNGRVLKRIALGHLDKEICDELYMSPSALRYHKDIISNKTNTNRKPALVRIALQIGLI